MRTLSAAALLAMLATPAFAFHCPADIAKIDAAMAANPEISDEDKLKVEELRNKGELLHNSGDHQAAVDTLAEALQILGIE